MKNNIIKSEMDVKGSKINVVRVNGYEYISLTDLAKTQNDEAPADVVKNWLRNKETLSFLGVWEELNNENFKVVEFDQFKNQAGRHAFTMSPQKWIRETNAIGIISKSGKYEDFILKCKERLCSAAQLEIMQQTRETLLKYKKSLEESNSPLATDRGTFPDFECSQDCHFTEGKLLIRKI